MPSRIALPEDVALVERGVGIVVRCRVCDEEKAASELVDMRCLDCRLGEKLRPRFERIAHLLRKQRRMHGLGPGRSRGTDEQVGRELRRIWADIGALVPQRARRHEYLNRFLGQAQRATGLSRSEVEAAVGG